MHPYDIGAALALEKKADVYPEEYNSAGMVGTLGGGALGGALGAAAGHQIGDHLGQMTRERLLGIPIPGTGVGEHILSYNRGPVAGEAIGALGGAALGGAMGHHGGQLAALRRSSPPRRVVNPAGQMDPRLMAYLMQQSQG